MTPTAAAPLVVDPRNLERLRTTAGQSPEKAVKDAAKQFESMFVNMLLKSMRDAQPSNGPLDSEQSRMYTGMLDQQLSQSIASGRGLGLADMMARQLMREGVPGHSTTDAAAALGGAPRNLAPATPAPAATNAPAAATEPTPPTAPTARARDFINKVWPHAVAAAKVTGIPPHFMVGQAALESGWGAREIKTADGATTHNIFGIKATKNWGGESAATMTTEFVNGVKQKMVDKFRSYSSYGEAFMDYANMLKSNPRYAAVLEAGDDPQKFAKGLQKAGYATDPAYASKLTRIITGTVMKQGLSG